MSTGFWSRRRFALALAVALTAVPLAYAAEPADAATEMRFACAKKRNGELRYVARAGACSSRERSIRFRRRVKSLIACARQGGNVYIVDKRRECRREPHAPSLVLRLPDNDERKSFCAHKGTGALRSIEHVPYDAPRPFRGGSTCKSDEKRVFVRRKNRRPIARDDAATVGEDRAAAIDVLDNDSDPEGRPLTVASVNARATRGTVTIAADRRSVTYDPSGRFESLGAGAIAIDTFSYKASDGRRRDRARVTVTVRGANDAPVAAADAAATNEDTATTIAVLANDSDPDQGDVLSVTAVDTTGTAGAVTINPNGTLRYNPAGRLDGLRAGETRTDRFTYTISDGNGGSATATVSVRVTGVNDAPFVTTSGGDTPYAENAPDPLEVDPGLTVTDADDVNLESARVRIVTGLQAAEDRLLFTDQNGIVGAYDAATGVLTLTGTATVADYRTALASVEFEHTGDNPAASKTIEFTANDGDAGSAPAIKRIVITGPDDPPIAVNDDATVDEDAAPTTIDVLANDTDVDAGPKAIATADDTLANGTVVVAPDGTSLTYEPDADYCNSQAGGSPDEFTYELNGGSTATVFVTVTCADDAPAGVDDSASVGEDSGANAIDVLANDTDIDGGPMSVESVTQPVNNGTVAITGGGTGLTYQPAADYCNDPPGTTLDTFMYTLNGGDTATVSVTVACTDDAPVAIDDSATVAEDSAPTAIDVLANDTDIDGGPIAIASAGDPANGTVAITGGGTSLTYMPDANYCNSQAGGLPDTFTYELDGGSAATVSVTVTCADDAPTAVDDSATVGEDAPATAIDVLANDPDVDGGPKTIASASDPANGEVVLTGGSPGAHAGLTYEPDANYCNDPPGTSPDTFTYTLNGGSTATVSVTVTCANDAPVVTTSGGATSYTEGGAAAVVDAGLTVTDADDANLEGATVSIVGGFDSGDELVFVNQLGITGAYDTGTGVLTLTGTASVADYQTALRSIAFSTTHDNPATPKSVQFTADDGDADSAPAIKSIAVTRVNDAPALDTTDAALAYPEGGGPLAADAGITVTDPDSTQIQGATVQIAAGFVAADDELAFANQLGITGAYDDTTGTLTLTGTATVADYQAALRAVTYENVSQNPTGSRTLEFRATDAEGAASAAATRDITLGPANDAATITTSGTALSYSEGDPATPVDPGLTVADPDDTSLEGARVRISAGFQSGDELVFVNQLGISGVYNTGTGVLTLTGTASIADYQTALRSVEFRTTNDTPVATKTAEFSADDGDGLGPASTRNIDITPTDDPPVAVDDSATVGEDAAATAIDVLANDTDVDGGPRSIDSATQPADGTVIVTGGGTGLTYEPDASYCNSQAGGSPDTFTYTLNGGSTATVSVTVTCADDPPTAVGDSATVDEDSAPNAIDVLANDTDSDGGPKTIASASDPANGEVVLTGGSPGAHTGLTYEPDPNYCNDPPGTSPDTFTYTINGGSTATVSVTVTCVDDTPIAVNDSATVAEDSGASAIDVLTNDTDADGGLKAIASATDPANGTVVLTGGTPGAHTGLTYQPDANYCNSQAGGSPDTFTYSLNGGSTATVSVTVECAPDDPVVDTSAGATSYTENGAATVIDAAVTVSDPDPGATITGATVQITGGYAGGQDILALGGSHPGITPSLSGDTLTLTGTASVAAYQAALRDVTYRNSSDDPSTAARTVAFTVTDETSRTGSDTKGISVVAVDDPPTAVNDSATVLEDAAATAVTVLPNDTDVDGGPKSIGSVTQPANGTVAITGGGTGLTYQPNPNYCNDPPGTTPDTFTYTLNGGSTATVSMTVTCVNDAPVADDETFSGNDSAHGNTAMVVDDPDDGAPNPTYPKTTVSGDILAGDTDIDGPGPLTVIAGTFATNDGGSVTIEADGDFTFHPAASTSCTDTSDFFDYTVSDQNAAGPGPAPGTDTGRVTIAIAGCVWYVRNNAPGGGGGTSAAPFDTLVEAEAASAANHTVFVFDGDNTATGLDAGGYAMNAGERLIGEHEGLVVDPDGGGPLTADTLHPTNPGAHPTLTATNADVIDLDDGNEVRGLNVDPQGTGGGIAGTLGDTGGGTIDDVNVVDTVGANGSQAGLELNGTTGTFNVSNFTVNNNATGVLLNNAGTVNFTPAGTITITSAGAPGLSATNTNMGTSTFDAITVTGSASGGVSITNPTNPTPGTTTFGDLSLTTTSGATSAFGLSNAGTVSVPAAGTANVSATGGPAVDVTGTSGATLAFDNVSSTNSANDGINLAGLGTGTFSATGGSIAGAAGIAFDLDGGSGAISYPGALNNGAGATAEITGRGGGAVALSGAIADSNDAGGGITVTGNTGGSTTFSNPSKVINTGTGNAIVMGTSDGHTLTFSGGGLDVDATSGAGINATDSGTLTVSGTGNSVTTTTGTAVNVSNTDFGTATFQSISANGAANGISLNNTGATAGLTVTGVGSTTQGGDNSGGTIQSTTGHGISLTNTTGPSFRNMHLQNTGNSGVNGTQVNGFSFTDGRITGAGDASDENSITFDDSLTATPNLTGAVTITNNVISQTEAEGVDIENWGGTISDANISTNALSDTGDVATPGSAVTLIGSGTATSAASITKASVNNNTITDFRAGVGVQVRAGNPNAGAPTGSAGTAGSVTNVIAVTGNSMNGGNAGIGNQPDRFFTGGVSGNGGQGNFNVSSNGTAANRIRNIDCIAIEMQMDGPVTMTSTVQNNFINANSAVGCAGIAVGTDDPGDLGAGTHSTLISGNNVMGTDGPGIFPIVRDSGSTMTARVINNTVAAPITTNAARAGIRVDSGSSAGDTTLCLEISGNTTAGSTNTGTGTTSPGINLRKQGTDPNINTFGIEGLSPAPTGTPNVENHVNSLNTSTSGTFGVGGTALLSATTGFTSCTAP